MEMPELSFDDGRVGLALVIAGLVLIAGGAMPYALALADGPYDYTVSAEPVSDADHDVNAEALTAAERGIVVNATAAPLFDQQSQGSYSETVSTDAELREPLDTTLDSAPEGFTDGDVVRIQYAEPDVELLATGDDSGTYKVTVDKTLEAWDMTLYGVFCAGLFVLAFGLKKRDDAQQN